MKLLSVTVRHKISVHAVALLSMLVAGCDPVGIVSEILLGGDIREFNAAESCDRPPNGCGPAGILGDIVPECPLIGVCFTEACNAHDICYRDCGVEKSLCDNAFLLFMLDTCADAYAPDDPFRRRCEDLASVYAFAVDLLGNEVFLVTQLLGCTCPLSRLAEKQTNESVPDLLSLGPPFEDADGDILPDDWEISVGLDPFYSGDTTADYDGDGLNNLVEFIRDTDPFVADDVAMLLATEQP